MEIMSIAVIERHLKKILFHKRKGEKADLYFGTYENGTAALTLKS